MTPGSVSRQRRITLSLLFLAGVVNFLDRSSLSIANATIRAEMHLDATQMGWLLTAFSLAYGIGQLPLIGLLDRAGTRVVLGAGLAVWSAAQFLTGLVAGLRPFLGLRVLLGLGEAPFYPAGVRSVSEWFPPAARGRATAAMSMSQTLGLAVAPPVLTLLILQVGWRRTFMLLGVAGMSVAVAWVSLHRTREEPERHTSQPSFPGRSRDPGTGAGVWRELLRQRTVWGMMLGFGGINYTSWLYISWLPGYLETGRRLSLAKSGWLAAIPFLCGALGMWSSGVLADTLGRRGMALATVHRGIVVAGMVASALGTFLVVRCATTGEAVACLGAALFFIHFAGTSGWGYVQTVSPPRLVASLSALQNFASFMIASAAPVATGWLLDRTHSFSISLGLCSGVTLLGALSYATLAAPDGMGIQP